MTRFIALIDGQPGAYGIAFPDAPGCVAMGSTVDEVMHNAVSSLSAWVAHSDSEGFQRPSASSAEHLRGEPDVREQLAEGAAFAVVPLILEGGRPVLANLSIDADLLAAIDEAAAASGLSRSAFLASAARDKILAGV